MTDKQTDGQTDRQTDTFAIRKTVLHTMQRGKNKQFDLNDCQSLCLYVQTVAVFSVSLTGIDFFLASSLCKHKCLEVQKLDFYLLKPQLQSSHCWERRQGVIVCPSFSPPSSFLAPVSAVATVDLAYPLSCVHVAQSTHLGMRCVVSIKFTNFHVTCLYDGKVFRTVLFSER